MSTNYGNALTDLGLRQPSGGIHYDPFGMAQAQTIWRINGGPSQMSNIIDIQNKIKSRDSSVMVYPESLGFSMIAYKWDITFDKANIATLTIDYMGVYAAEGYSNAQCTGVANTSAQPIETHPNFTYLQLNGGDTGFDSATPLAGTAEGTRYNNAMFTKNSSSNYWAFNGFGVSNVATAANKKAGVRQYLKPMWTVRGTIFLGPDHLDKAALMTNHVGWRLHDPDQTTLITPNSLVGALSGAYCLLTTANAECIGNVNQPAAIKVVYDIMISGEFPWDPDIYPTMTTPIFPD